VEHLLNFFDRYIHGRWTALLHDDGLRQWSYTADQSRATSEAFARRIQEANLQSGDRLVIWSDSCPEWLAAFWAPCSAALPSFLSTGALLLNSFVAS
jgi:acyl-CoA synthetase (AMP-forming)/AMP-acid ligase II